MKEQLEVKIITKSGNVPSFGSENAACVDLESYFLDAKIEDIASYNTIISHTPEGAIESVIINPGGRALIPTGLFIAVPVGYEAVVRPRSGLAIKLGIGVLNADGTIDADYRGEVKVILINHGKEPVTIANGERIAQLGIRQVPLFVWNKVDTLDDTVRGEGGFGSTGTK